MPELTRERLGALRVQARRKLLAADRREVLCLRGHGLHCGRLAEDLRLPEVRV